MKKYVEEVNINTTVYFGLFELKNKLKNNLSTSDGGTTDFKGTMSSLTDSSILWILRN
jgi:hypothetical protein